MVQANQPYSTSNLPMLTGENVLRIREQLSVEISVIFLLQVSVISAIVVICSLV
ncbi:hypothetical protein PEPS_18350 [Persicobacter psychrovividus]|uniref:Uncharacterized protein n=1 Tax=Persicobacter psychrovividus TaxID=387638 RepID=A0ABM7VFD4_9BACT|nr:hypothetical protein PEPS_18350 [Persicobacter psychrovividus]